MNSLAQTLMKHTAPGVPDLYQGAELWDLSLVDPDNRRPVDYAAAERLLHEIEGDAGGRQRREAMRRADEGSAEAVDDSPGAAAAAGAAGELWARRRTIRRSRWRGEGDHVIAYLRGEDVVTVVPRLTLKLDGAWKDTIVVLPKGEWRNRLTGVRVNGGVIAMKVLLKDFPVALLNAARGLESVCNA